MEFKDLEEILTYLKNIKNNNYFGSDLKKIDYLFTEIEKMQTILPTIDKLNELQKVEIELEVTYDEFNELGNYFTPLYIKIKNKIHNEYVHKLREKNKKKRGTN